MIHDKIADLIGVSYFCFSYEKERSMNPVTLDIRSLPPEDLTAAAELLQACDLPHADLVSSSVDLFVYRTDGPLLGMIGLQYEAPNGLLRSLAVAPERRGQQLGARLVDFVEERARSLGIERLYLLTTTAVDYFRRRDYQVIAREHAPTYLQGTTEFASLCPESAVIMCKHLNGGL